MVNMDIPRKRILGYEVEYSNSYCGTTNDTCCRDPWNTSLNLYESYTPIRFKIKEKTKEWKRITADFWGWLHQANPVIHPMKMTYPWNQEHRRFNPLAFKRQMLFSKAGKIPAKTRRKKKCRSSS